MSSQPYCLADAPFSTSGTAAVGRLREHLDQTAPDGLTHHVTGIGGLAADQANGVVESFDRTAMVTVVLVLVILFLIYRSVVAALIPLLTIGRSTPYAEASPTRMPPSSRVPPSLPTSFL